MSGVGQSSRVALCGGHGTPARGGAAASSIVNRGPAATCTSGGAAAGLWPSWARDQLLAAVSIAAGTPADVSVARVLHREWYSPLVGRMGAGRSGSTGATARLPLAGVLRAAHAGSRRRVTGDGVSVVRRSDLIGPDGWWRTWGDAWLPPRRRHGAVRLMLTPRVEHLPELVSAVTAALLDTELAWSLGCATNPRRLRRYGGVVLDVASLDDVPAGLLAGLAPLLHPVAPPLTLPVAPGIGAAAHPDHRMTFGEHRCHLVALALRDPAGRREPLRRIAATFASAGIDPATPYRAG
jgi:hypothetical protein